MLKLIFGRPNASAPVKVLGIAGSTCTGKSTLTKAFQQRLRENGVIAEILGQDDFYKQKEEVTSLENADDPRITFYNYDEPESLNQEKMLQAVREHRSRPIDVLIVEGNMITDLPLLEEIDCTLFMTIEREVCRPRRMLRAYDPPDENGYFDQIVWPSYERTLTRAKALEGEYQIAFRDAKTTISLDEVVNEFHHLICDRLELKSSRIDATAAINNVNSVGCGASSIFIGTTRDTFEGKTVQRLEYEAYEKMAYSEMARLCKEVREKQPTILKVSISHRLGQVPVGEASVIIATSAPQRKAAIEATEWLINTLKERVPIWKKELYTDGTCSWKENQEQVASRRNS